MSTSLGFKLNVSTGLDGVGFINPESLPDFDSDLQALHLTRRSYTFSNWNRVTQEQGGVSDAGAIPEPEWIYTANASQNIELQSPSIDQGAGFTVAVALQGASLQGAVANDRVSIVISENFENDSGFRIEMRESSSNDFTLNGRIFTDAGGADARRDARDFPSGGEAFWVFLSWDGSDLILHSPPVTATPDVGSIDQEFAGDTAPINESLFFGRSREGNTDPSRVTDHKYWGYAQWGRGLSTSEIEQEHEKLIEWGSALGVDFAPAL